MNVECEVLTEFVDPLIVRFDSEFGFEYGEGIDIGKKKFKKPGAFEYEWFATGLSRTEVQQLIVTLLFAVDHMPDESDVCDECVAEAAAKGGK